MNDLGFMVPLVVAVLVSAGLSLFDSDDARRELKRHRLVRVADLHTGAARIDGRVVAVDSPANAPAGGTVAVVSTVSMGTAMHPELGWIVAATPEQRFFVDDGSGQALIVVPPPPPQPLPGDDLDYEILCSLASTEGGRRANNGVVRAGDQVSIGGYASIIVDPTGNAPSYRGPPTRFMLTATRYYPLLIVKR
jgi:hypothetical protein